MISSDKIFEWEDLLDQYTVHWIEKVMKEYPVSYGHKSSEDSDVFFGRIFYWNGFREDFNQNNLPAPVSYMASFVREQVPELIGKSFGGFQRILVNGQTETQNGGIHFDDKTDSNLWTILYYVTESEGGNTLIFDSMKSKKLFHECKYKKGKLIAFPSTYVHQALCPTSGWRMSMAFGVYLK